MIRKEYILLCIIFYSCALHLSAQEWKNVILPGNGWIEQSTNAIQLEDRRLLLSVNNSPTKSAGYVHTNFYIIDTNIVNFIYRAPLSSNGNTQGSTLLNNLGNRFSFFQTIGFGGITSHYQIINTMKDLTLLLDTFSIDINNHVPRQTIYSNVNSCIAVIGSSMPNINKLYDHFRLYDTLGNMLYEKKYNFVTGTLKLFTKDSGYISIGIQTINNVKMLNYFLFDKLGNISNQKLIFTSLSINQVYDFVELPDGRIRFIVEAKPTGTIEPRRTYIATISAEGDSLDLLDTKNDSRWPIINDSTQIGARMVYTKDNHFLYSILTDRFQTSGSYVVKMDTNYVIKWMHETFAPLGLSHLFAASDGGYYGIAEIPSTDPEKNREILVFKSDSTGFYNSVRTVSTEIENEIFLSPNPAITQVHITSPVKLESYTINNTSGTQLQSGVLENDNNIDISQLPQGLYFLQVQLENGQMVTKKLVRSY
jgi:hypothetical protein